VRAGIQEFARLRDLLPHFFVLLEQQSIEALEVRGREEALQQLVVFVLVLHLSRASPVRRRRRAQRWDLVPALEVVAALGDHDAGDRELAVGSAGEHFAQVPGERIAGEHFVLALGERIAEVLGRDAVLLAGELVEPISHLLVAQALNPESALAVQLHCALFRLLSGGR